MFLFNVQMFCGFPFPRLQSLFPIFDLIYAQLLFTVRGRSLEGAWLRGVRAWRRRRRVQVVRVAALGVRRRRAALTVLLG